MTSRVNYVMSFFKRSNAQDVADRWNSFWTVLIFVLLAIITFPTSFRQDQVTKQDGADLEFTAICLCPREFTKALVDYSNAFCSDVYNKNYDDVNNSGYLHTILDPKIQRLPLIQTKNMTKDVTVPDKGTRRATTYVTYLPSLLFLLAVVLKLPYIVYNLCFGYSIDHTIEWTAQVQFLEEPKRQQLSQDFSQFLQSRPRSAGVVYLLVKLICCVIIVTGLVIHNMIFYMNQDTEVTTDLVNPEPRRQSQHLLCDLDIRQLGNVQRYSLQCLFTARNNPTVIENKSAPNFPEYTPVYQTITLYLLILLVVNVVSLTLWVSRLVFGLLVPPSVQTKSQGSIHLLLLLLLSLENSGPLVTRELAQIFSNLSVGEVCGDEDDNGRGGGDNVVVTDSAIEGVGVVEHVDLEKMADVDLKI